jgi:hypothetical protein
MVNNRLPRLDRSVLIVSSPDENWEEKSYWFSKTPDERLEAVEQMRQIVYGYDPATTRLQRFFEIAQRARS